MKKIMSWILLLCIMLSLMPTMPARATDSVDKTESGGGGFPNPSQLSAGDGDWDRVTGLGWKMSMIKAQGERSGVTSYNILKEGGYQKMVDDINLSYDVRFPNTDGTKSLYGLSNKRIDRVTYMHPLADSCVEVSRGDGNLGGHILGDALIRFDWTGLADIPEPPDVSAKGMYNYIGGYLWQEYGSKGKLMPSEDIEKCLDSDIVYTREWDGLTATIDDASCKAVIRSLFGCGEYAPDVLSILCWTKDAVEAFGGLLGEGCEITGTLGMLMMMYKACSDSNVRSVWKSLILEYARYYSNPELCDSYQPLLIVMEPCITYTRTGDRIVMNTASEFIGQMIGSRSLLYDPPVIFSQAAPWTTEQLVSYLHKNSGMENICCKNQYSQEVFKISSLLNNHWWDCGQTNGTVFGNELGKGCVGTYAYASPVKWGYSLVGSVAPVDPPTVTVKDIPFTLDGRSGVKSDPIVKKTTDKFSESVTVRINMKQEDTVKHADASTWIMFKESLKAKPSALDITVWLKRDEVLVDKSVGDYACGKITPISLEDLDLLMTGKKELIYMDLVEGNTPRNYKYSAGINIGWVEAGVRKSVLLRQEPRDCFSSFYSDNKEPHYYSEVETPYAEIKEGTINNETFNAMQGTPTTRNLYFACGGSEYVVQMESKLVTNQSASRSYSKSFTDVQCDAWSCSPHCHGHGSDPTTFCGSCCHCGCHDCGSNPSHNLAETVSWTQQITGFSYMQITDCKVWELSQAKVDGMRELIDTDVVTATVQSTAPQALFNIAQGNTAQQGRLYHSYQPGSYDNHVFSTVASSASCGNSHQDNVDTVGSEISGVTDKVTCVSDYLVLRTSNGDQAIVYYEYDCDAEVPIGKVTGGSITADPIKFSKSITEDMVWRANTQTSAGISMQASDITYGGYNGDFTDLANKYVSTGSRENINVPSLTISKPSYKGGSITNAGSVSGSKATAPFKLAKYNLDIPDTKRNGEYVTGRAQVFYKNLLNYGGVPAFYPIESCSGFNGQGFKLDAVYGKVANTTDKINNVVVHNPTSTEDACIVALPASRDQRTTEYKDMEQPKQAANEKCPCIAEECPYSTLNCQYKGSHVHTSDCYKTMKLDYSKPFEKHVHTEACYTTVKGCPSCKSPNFFWDLYFSGYHCIDCNSWFYTPTDVLDCNNLPLNIHSHGPSCFEHDWRCGWCVSCEMYVTTSVGGACDDGWKCTKCGAYQDYARVGVHRPMLSSIPPGKAGCSRGTCKNPSLLNAHTHTDACKKRVLKCNNQPLNAYNPDIHNHTSSCPQRGEYTCGYSPDNIHEHNGACMSTYIYCRKCCAIHHHDELLTEPSGYLAVHDDGTTTVVDTVDYGPVCGDVPLNAHEHDSSCKRGYSCNNLPLNGFSGGSETTPIKIKKEVTVLSCTEPHHAFGSSWKSYTKGYTHTDGTVCTGDNCTNSTPLKLFKECIPSGYIVQHSNGQVHASNNQTICDTCGQQISKVLGKATNGNSVPLTSSSHYEFGNEVCYDACCDDKRHEVNKTDVTPSTGGSLDIGEFINLDYGFTVYFPNEGDFFGDGVMGSSTTSKTEGAGYVNNMDITEWVKDKYVVFPFDVVSEWNNTTCIGGIPIHLPINESTYKFYCCVSNSEMDNARCKFVMIPINNVSGNVDNNVPSNYARQANLAAAHSGYKEQFIDIVGRIGALTIEDTGDFRFSELFKNRVEPATSWIIPGVVAKVDTTSQRYVMTDSVDVRGEDVSKTTNFADTYDTSPERRQKLIRFPLTPNANNMKPLMKQPLRPGYPIYMDLTTIGNYYGENYVTNKGTASNYKVQITPYYYHLNLQTGKWTPVDCYINVNNVYKSINLFDNKGEAGYNFATPMNWLEESGRRNSTQEILDRSMKVRDEYQTTIPAGTNIYIGNAQRLHLRDVTRNFVGAETQNTKQHDPSNLLDDITATRQIQRYNFSLKLPSSVAFVERGKTCTQENINSLRKQSAVIVCAAEVFAAGTVWNLKYAADTLNSQFKVTPESATYDPAGGPGDKPIIAVYSISKTSKNDLEVVGKH